MNSLKVKVAFSVIVVLITLFVVNNMQQTMASDVATKINITLKSGNEVIASGSSIEKKVNEELNLSAVTNTNMAIIHVVYMWDNTTPVELNGDKAVVKVPSTFKAGETHTLKTSAEAADGTIANVVSYNVKVYEEVVEPTSITLTVKDGSKVITSGSSIEKKINEELNISAVANKNLAIVHVVYMWDNTTPVELNGDKAVVKVPSTFKAGETHTLKISAEAADGTIANVVSYNVKVYEEVVEPTSITLTVKDGSKVITSGSSIEKKINEELNISAVANKNLAIIHIAYMWDNVTAVELNGASAVIKVPSTFKAGETHTLMLSAEAADGTIAPASKYIIIIPGEISKVEDCVEEEIKSIDDELIIEYGMKESKELVNLAVSLRHEPYENDKVNKNIYELEESITFYVDYKNGTKRDIDKASIVLSFPLNVEVVDSFGGTVKGNKITWVFEDGIEKKQSGTKVVVVKYINLGKDSLTYKVVYPTATIYNGTKKADTSSVIQLIFKSEYTKIKEEHEPYMYGDKDNGTFRPDEGITRAEGALVLTRIFGINTSNVKVTNVYTDLGETYIEAQKAIVAASKYKLIDGDPDGKYRPNDKMTRAEFMKILAARLDSKSNSIAIKDTDGEIKVYNNSGRYRNSNDDHWAIPYVTLLARLNMTDLAKKNKDLRLDDEITRAEVAQLANLFLFRAPVKVTSKTVSEFEDVTKSHKLFADIVEATQATHIYKFTLEGKEISL